MRLICYLFNPLNTEFRSREKKTQFLSIISFLDRFSASTVVSMEMAKNEIFSSCLFCFLKWKLLVMLRSVYEWSVFWIFQDLIYCAQRTMLQTLLQLVRGRRPRLLVGTVSKNVFLDVFAFEMLPIFSFAFQTSGDFLKLF